jgi:heptaprenylglyceryl phosphate synthase
MLIAYWTTRYLLAAAVLATLLVLLEYGKGTPGTADLISAVAWAMAAAAIFVGAGYWRSRKATRAKACRMCRDASD